MVAFSGIYTKTGNRKLGGGVGTINRMPGATCPGASTWCKQYCYAKKGLFIFQHMRYQSQTITIPDKLSKAVRVHAAGDFDTVEYIAWIHTVALEHPATLFWAYTRSWRVPSLVDALERLRALPNFQLFASVDQTIAEMPPHGWRVAYMDGDARFKGMVCLEQREDGNGAKFMPNCKACTYCFRKTRGNVAFIPHSGAEKVGA